jgi:hypothetical protein
MRLMVMVIEKSLGNDHVTALYDGGLTLLGKPTAS